MTPVARIGGVSGRLVSKNPGKDAHGRLGVTDEKIRIGGCFAVLSPNVWSVLVAQLFSSVLFVSTWIACGKGNF